jgi:hypothetical protein
MKDDLEINLHDIGGEFTLDMFEEETTVQNSYSGKPPQSKRAAVHKFAGRKAKPYSPTSCRQ